LDKNYFGKIASNLISLLVIFNGSSVVFVLAAVPALPAVDGYDPAAEPAEDGAFAPVDYRTLA